MNKISLKMVLLLSILNKTKKHVWHLLCIREMFSTNTSTPSWCWKALKPRRGHQEQIQAVLNTAQKCNINPMHIHNSIIGTLVNNSAEHPSLCRPCIQEHLPQCCLRCVIRKNSQWECFPLPHNKVSILTMV